MDAMSESLRRVLAETYGGRASSHFFAIDEATNRDRGTGSDGEYFHWYCAPSVRVDGVNRFWLQLLGTTPASDGFVALARTKECKIQAGRVEILLTVRDTEFLRELAT